MAKTHTRYIFSMGELKRKNNSVMFKNEKGNHYIPIESLRELYCLNEVSFNTKFLDFIAKAGVTLHIFNYHGYYSGSFYPKESLISGELTLKQSLYYVENASLSLGRSSKALPKTSTKSSTTTTATARKTSKNSWIFSKQTSPIS